ncbi:MAG: hypothetical protein J6K03_02105 [Oscillospiraceae bacterium]|nr:hypothetical protein [Oscillospiraceae bacterium]
MDFIVILVLAALTFSLCFLVDKLHQKLFRSRQQHRTGKAVRLNKKFGAFGLILFILGLAALFTGLPSNWVLIAGGILIMLTGIGLVVYYMTYGIFYDSDSFLYTTFGKKSISYRYGQISHQQLYVLQGGNILLELHMKDSSAVQLQLQLAGAEDFLNTAFLGWVQQNNIDIRTTNFHDPKNSCWFPSGEDL